MCEWGALVVENHRWKWVHSGSELWKVHVFLVLWTVGHRFSIITMGCERKRKRKKQKKDFTSKAKHLLNETQHGSWYSVPQQAEELDTLSEEKMNTKGEKGGR